MRETRLSKFEGAVLLLAGILGENARVFKADKALVASLDFRTSLWKQYPALAAGKLNFIYNRGG